MKRSLKVDVILDRRENITSRRDDIDFIVRKLRSGNATPEEQSYAAMVISCLMPRRPGRPKTRVPDHIKQYTYDMVERLRKHFELIGRSDAHGDALEEMKKIFIEEGKPKDIKTIRRYYRSEKARRIKKNANLNPLLAPWD